MLWVWTPLASKAEGNERRLSPAFLELARQKALYQNLEVIAHVFGVQVVLCEVGHLQAQECHLP